MRNPLRSSVLVWTVSVLLAPSPSRAQDRDGGLPDAGSGSAAPELVPPRVIESVDPEYPAAHPTFDIQPVVALHVTIEIDGTVGEVHVEHPGDRDFDDAAIAAVRRWRFEPGRRGDQPIRSRVRVEVRFRAPPPLAEPTESRRTEEPEAEGGAHSRNSNSRVSARTQAEVARPQEDEDDDGEEVRLGVTASVDADPLRESRSPRAARDYALERDALEAAPHRDAADLLSSAPGVYVARPEGDAVAQRIFLRGFDAEHGQDIELTLGGGVMPLNLPSHIHGQGYADLGFVIPEVVRRLRITEGVYDPRQGDFATAGSIDFELGVGRRGVQARASYGSFDTFRALLLWAPDGEREESFAAGTYRTTSGFGENRAGQSGGALLQWVIGGRDARVRIHGSAWAARTTLAGFLRREDVDAGRVDFLGVYDDPSALAQSALSARAHLGGVLELRGDRGSFGEISAWLLWSDFRLQANYTGYFERSQVDADQVGRGDLIEQRNETLGLGLRARYRTPRFDLFDWLRGFVELGLQGRVDAIGQVQNLLDAGQNETWDRRADADVRALDVAGYVDLDWRITDFVRVRGGLRLDVLFYDIDDRLSNFIPDERPETYIVGYRRSALGAVAGPRVSIEVTPVAPLVLAVAYGEGYRSPQARQLQDGESAPFARVRSGDVGARLRLGDHDELVLSASGYLTHVGDDTAFDPSQGRLERIGPTTRMGAVLYGEARPWSFLTATASVTYVYATLDAPPPSSIESPRPLYRQGEALPFVPPWVVRADASAGERLFDIAGMPFIARVGVGFSFLSSRPLPYALAAEPVALLDASVRARWSAVDLSLEIFNLLDARYAAVEYSYASYWDTSSVPSRLPVRHIAAGAPLTVMATLGVTL